MYFLGIHLGGSAALIRQKEGGIEWVKHLDVKRLDILQPLLDKKPYQLVTGLSTSAILLRTLKLQLKSKREILATLPFQIEGILPAPLDEFILKPTIYKERPSTPRKDTISKFTYTGSSSPGLSKQKSEGRSASSSKRGKVDLSTPSNEVLLLAVKKSALERHLSLCTEQGLDPDVVSCVPLALWRFARYFFPKVDSLLLFHFGENENTIIAIEKGLLKLSYAFFLGDPQHLERAIAFVRKKSPQLTGAFLAGQAPPQALPLLQKYFELLELPTHAQEMSEHAIALGLALDALVRDQDSLQLRQGNYTSVKARQKRKRQLVSYWTACSIAFLLTLSGTHFALKTHENKILGALSEFPANSAAEAVHLAEQQLAKKQQSLLHQPFSPKLSDFLAWLSNHPIFSPKEGDLTIEQLRYQLVPDARKATLLRPLIELQVRYNIASIGRSLREALLADHSFIDQSKAVSFKGQNSRAEIAFQLKEKACPR